MDEVRIQEGGGRGGGAERRVESAGTHGIVFEFPASENLQKSGSKNPASPPAGNFGFQRDQTESPDSAVWSPE